jgi:hypothetical protein
MKTMFGRSSAEEPAAASAKTKPKSERMTVMKEDLPE